MSEAATPTQTTANAAPEEVIYVTTNSVACDGGGGALGHPRVFLTIGENGDVICGYCGRRYVKKAE